MSINEAPRFRVTRGSFLLALAAWIVPTGCDRGRASSEKQNAQQAKSKADSESSKVEAVKLIKPERRDIRISVVQPGTIQSYEATPIDRPREHGRHG